MKISPQVAYPVQPKKTFARIPLRTPSPSTHSPVFSGLTEIRTNTREATQICFNFLRDLQHATETNDIRLTAPAKGGEIFVNNDGGPGNFTDKVFYDANFTWKDQNWRLHRDGGIRDYVYSYYVDTRAQYYYDYVTLKGPGIKFAYKLYQPAPYSWKDAVENFTFQMTGNSDELTGYQEYKKPGRLNKTLEATLNTLENKVFGIWKPNPADRPGFVRPSFDADYKVTQDTLATLETLQNLVQAKNLGPIQKANGVIRDKNINYTASIETVDYHVLNIQRANEGITLELRHNTTFSWLMGLVGLTKPTTLKITPDMLVLNGSYTKDKTAKEQGRKLVETLEAIVL